MRDLVLVEPHAQRAPEFATPVEAVTFFGWDGYADVALAATSQERRPPQQLRSERVFRSAVVGTVKRIYRPFGVDVVSTRPADGDYSTVVIGAVEPNVYLIDADQVHPIVGYSEAVDCDNSNRNDMALVNVPGVYEDGYLRNRPFGSYIGIVVAHEIGHLLGLNHTTEQSSLMGDLDRSDGPIEIGVGQLLGNGCPSSSAAINWSVIQSSVPDELSERIAVRTHLVPTYMTGLSSVTSIAALFGQTEAALIGQASELATALVEAGQLAYDYEIAMPFAVQFGPQYLRCTVGSSAGLEN